MIRQIQNLLPRKLVTEAAPVVAAAAPSAAPAELTAAIAGSVFGGFGVALPRGQKAPWPVRHTPHVTLPATKARLFKRFARAAEKAAALEKDINRFFKAVVTSNFDFHNVGYEPARVEELAERVVQHAALKALPRLPVLGAEVAVRPAAEVRELMAQALVPLAAAAAAQVVAGLKALREAEQVGHIRWLGRDGVCQYRYCRWLVSEDLLHERRTTLQVSDRPAGAGRTERTTTTSVERKLRRSLSRTIHRHDLLNARAHSLVEDRGPKPRRVRELMAAIPAWLLPLVTCVRGVEIAHTHEGQTLLSETTTETATEVQTEIRTVNVYRWDPCLVVGDFVLTGWEEQEEADDGSARVSSSVGALALPGPVAAPPAAGRWADWLSSLLPQGAGATLAVCAVLATALFVRATATRSDEPAPPTPPRTATHDERPPPGGRESPRLWLEMRKGKSTR